MNRQSVAAIVICLLYAGCTPKDPLPPAGLTLPDIKPAASLPQFANAINEVQIAQSFNDVDPSWIIGALVHVKTGKIFALDSYLKQSAKPIVTPQTEVVFKNFIENSVAANAQWLEFVKAEVSDKTRAEVSVAKTVKVSVDNQSVDKEQLLRQLENNKISPRDEYGVIIGYVSYVLSASYFRDQGAGGSVGGYGAKIGGNWFSKVENSAAHHRIVAVWSPLPFVIEVVDKRIPGDLIESTKKALAAGQLRVQKFASPNATIERLQ